MEYWLLVTVSPEAVCYIQDRHRQCRGQPTNRVINFLSLARAPAQNGCFFLVVPSVDFFIILHQPVGQFSFVQQTRLHFLRLSLSVHLFEQFQLIVRSRNHQIDHLVIWDLIFLLLIHLVLVQNAL
uniref:Uncharacterized protein n=1 Tax=Anopheles coluzzii TaxID=1518534 RepID=A0A8W7Q250_ANOCL